MQKKWQKLVGLTLCLAFLLSVGFLIYERKQLKSISEATK